MISYAYWFLKQCINSQSKSFVYKNHKLKMRGIWKELRWVERYQMLEKSVLTNYGNPKIKMEI